MLFSQMYELTPADDDDWFDPDLSSDTKLFVDPMLIWEDDDSFWSSAHGQVVDYFNIVLQLVAQGLPFGGEGAAKSTLLTRAERALQFAEPPEFCLGYGSDSIFGSGSAEVLAKATLDAAVFAVKSGLTHVDHFEQIALFGEGIGADRISDIVCNVLKSYFVRYTQDIAKANDVPLEDIKVRNLRWRESPLGWVDGSAMLPLNKAQHRRVGVLLVPRRFLRRLPTLDPKEFWEWAWSNLNEEIRADFGDDVVRHVDAETIMRFARRRSRSVARFIREREQSGSTSYDFEDDPLYLRRWSIDAPEIAKSMTASKLSNEGELCTFVGGVCKQFKFGVEKRNHYELLWVNGKLRIERYCQRLFDSTVFLTCENSNVDVSPEANGGVGPVDFKFSQGRTRAVAELKLAKSTSLRQNLEHQVPAYADTERTTCAYVVIVQSLDKHVADDFVKEIEVLIRRVGRERQLDYKVVWVDARQKPSASKRRHVE